MQVFLRIEAREGGTLQGVHGSNVIEDEGFTALSSQQAGLSCVFFLAGDVEVRTGDRDLRFRGNGTLLDAPVTPSVRRKLSSDQMAHFAATD